MGIGPKDTYPDEAEKGRKKSIYEGLKGSKTHNEVILEVESVNRNRKFTS